MLCGIDLCTGLRNKDKASDLRLYEAEDSDATNLSHVGSAAYSALSKKHGWHHNKLWNVTTGKVIGEVHQTPTMQESFVSKSDPKQGTSDWFPAKMCEIMSKTEVWCDILSLAPPDGAFVDTFKQALVTISERARELDPVTKMKKPPVVIRMMFGNLPAMPVNCDAVIKKLTEDLPQDGSANVEVWVGAWRLGASWNHAKIIAVDGKYLHTGGHNLWDGHYLQKKPVHDLSLEMEGRIALDGHMFANYQWEFIRKKQSTCVGQMAEKIPDSLPLIWANRVIVSEFPEAIAPEFPPEFTYTSVPFYEQLEDTIPVIGVGRLGALMQPSHPILYKDRPSDDAFIAMIDASKDNIKLTLQDIGPVCIPGTKQALPGCSWPKPYLNAFARAIWLRGVDIEMILSNPGSIPNDLSPTEANYGNGWSCVDVAAEIIKRIRKQFPEADDDNLRQKVQDNLRISFIRQAQGQTYKDGTSIGLHSKHFIVDDCCTYIGSQNLYVCDLAEWGVIIDQEAKTKEILDEYWHPMWEASYNEADCDVDAVMDGLDIDRDGEDENNVSAETKRLMMEQKACEYQMSSNADFYNKDEE